MPQKKNDVAENHAQQVNMQRVTARATILKGLLDLARPSRTFLDADRTSKASLELMAGAMKALRWVSPQRASPPVPQRDRTCGLSGHKGHSLREAYITGFRRGAGEGRTLSSSPAA